MMEEGLVPLMEHYIPSVMTERPIVGKATVMEEPIVIEEMIVTEKMIVIEEPVMVKDNYRRKREEIEPGKKADGLPPPPGRWFHPARTPIIIIVGVIHGSRWWR